MRILLIPLDTFDLSTNLPIPTRIRLLSKRNKLIGVERVADFTVGGLPGIAAYVKFISYAVKVFPFGLKHRKEFDLVYCFGGFYTVVGLGISLLTGKPCVKDSFGVFREWLQRVKPSTFFTLAVLTAEKVVKRFASMNIVLSEADKKGYIKQGFDTSKLAVIPRPADLSLANEIADDKEALRIRLGLPKNNRLLIFTGRRSYPPNREAAEWINQSLAPILWQRFDNVQILMTGAGKTLKPAHPIITFTGFVPNLFEYIYASDIFIAPIEIPSGRLTKVFDSLSCAMPTVVLASAVNGIPELADGHNAMVAKDRDEFIEKTVYLLEHPDEAQKIGAAGRRTLEKHYSWSTWEQTLNQVLERCVARYKEAKK